MIITLFCYFHITQSLYLRTLSFQRLHSSPCWKSLWLSVAAFSNDIVSCSDRVGTAIFRGNKARRFSSITTMTHWLRNVKQKKLRYYIMIYLNDSARCTFTWAIPFCPFKPRFENDIQPSWYIQCHKLPF